MALSSRSDAFNTRLLNRGLDKRRSQHIITRGDLVAAASTSFEAGMLVSLDANQEVVRCTGSDVLGISRVDFASSLYAAVQEEEIQFAIAGATANLAHANVRSAAGGVAGVRVHDGAGTVYTEGALNDYTVNYTNGVVTHVAAGTIPLATTVYIDYLYLVTTAELQFEGRDFWNSTQQPTFQSQKMAVITKGDVIFTAQYDPSATWAVNDSVTAGTTAEVLEGLFANGGAGDAVGTVFQVPTPDDPFLGIKLSL